MADYEVVIRHPWMDRVHRYVVDADSADSARIKATRRVIHDDGQACPVLKPRGADTVPFRRPQAERDRIAEGAITVQPFADMLRHAKARKLPVKLEAA